MNHRRPQFDQLFSRLQEKRRFIQLVVGPRQVGKTTLVRQVLDSLEIPSRYASADDPTLKGQDWIHLQWDLARRDFTGSGAESFVLVLDEVQKVSAWSESVKRLWDEDTAEELQLHVVLLGSAPLLIEHGLTESLAGRFETTRLFQWSLSEMESAFGWSIDQFILFGGYPGAAELIDDPTRWSSYLRDSLIETTISRDVLLLSNVEKPALLRRLFDLSTRYSGRELSYNKMLGQLQDAGNTTTLSHYLRLLESAGLVSGLQKYSGSIVRQRASSPKLQVHDTGLVTALSGRSPDELVSDRVAYGHLVESAVGSHLIHAMLDHQIDLFYWRERNREVDFVVQRGDRLLAIEVKSGPTRDRGSGLADFRKRYADAGILLVGPEGMSLDEFLRSDPHSLV